MKKLIIVAEIGIPLAFVTLFIIPYFIPIESDLSWPWFKIFMYGFRERIRSKADIPAIRDWLKSLNKEDYTDHAGRLHSDKWPKSLKVLNPGKATLAMDENVNPEIVLWWGGGIQHWGVAIGTESMQISHSAYRDYISYKLPVEPGVYVWFEL